MSGFDFNFGMLMLNVGKTYTGTPSSYIGWPNIIDFGFEVEFTRTDDLLSTTWTWEGTSNPRHTIKFDNEGGSMSKEKEKGFKTDNELI